MKLELNPSKMTVEELTDARYKRAHTDVTDKILSLADVLVDGEFKIELKNIRLRFRGSENQRIIDLPATLKNGEIVISEYS